MTRTLKTLTICFTLFGLGACMGQDQFVQPETLQQLSGIWVQKDGNAKIHFYEDETVKLSMPDTRPPTRLLSQLEVMKDDTLAFDTGDRWNGPVRIKAEKNWHVIHLHFPDKKDRDKEIILDFVRVGKH